MGSMLRWLLVLFLTVASATAWAQSPAANTAKAQEVAGVAEKRVAQLLGDRGTLTVRYEGELRAIDRLKQSKKTWNRDRELKEKLSTANETATQLAKLDKELTAAQQQLVGARRVLVTAIDTELAAKPPADRTAALTKLRDTLVPKVKPSVRRIAIPNMEVDPNADPEDLDAQAKELRQLEAELDRQAKSLDDQSKDLEAIAERRQAHIRTNTLSKRDDDNPSRVQVTSTGGGRTAADTGDSSPAPEAGHESGGGDTGGPPASEPSFEAEASVALQDVVDPSTIDTLTSAQRSGDPAKRSKAAAKTRDAVKAKLDLVRAARAKIEARSKALRK